ncbi:MAG: GNAT family N-acetyltransferase [Crocinitomicaceae bacterium]|nr:GNAT family N-acetyltransferase [Crocinitomicaceae bacterium]
MLNSDSDDFYDMMSNPNVMSPIPQRVKTREESDTNLHLLIQDPKEKTLWAICEKDNTEFIGLCALLVNNQGQDEIAYRLREQYWRQGYGREITAGLIDYCFQELNFKLITADVNTNNIPSVKILNKFMLPVREFYNENDKCTDRRYKLMNEKS